MNIQLNHQRGMSFIGILMILSMLGAFFLFGLRAFPLYTEYFSVKQAMGSVANQNYQDRNTIQKVRNVLQKNLDINGVYGFTDKKLKEVTKVKKEGSKRFLYIKYSKAEKLFDKLYLTIEIDEKVELTGSKENK
ncbi:MAG: hypothetical protein CMF40_05425 [Legionellales bacterium]|nr:hypothetical protein [Legionellales bacterium]